MTDIDVIVIDLPAGHTEPKTGFEPSYDEKLQGLYDTITRVCDDRDQARARCDDLTAQLAAKDRDLEAVRKELRRTKVALTGMDRVANALNIGCETLRARIAELEAGYRPRLGRRHRGTGETEN